MQQPGLLSPGEAGESDAEGSRSPSGPTCLFKTLLFLAPQPVGSAAALAGLPRCCLHVGERPAIAAARPPGASGPVQTGGGAEPGAPL